MLKRIRLCLTILSLAMLLGLAALWISGDVLIIREFFQVDDRSHLFVYHGGLQIDYSGLRNLLRDYRRASPLSLSVDDRGDLPAFELESVSPGGWMTFRWRNEYVHRTPLQDLYTSDGQPITIDVTVPLQLITLPAWTVAVLLAIGPGIGIVRLIRSRDCVHWLFAPTRFVRRRYVLTMTMATAIVCVLWALSAVRSSEFLLTPPLGEQDGRLITSANGQLTLYPEFRHRWLERRDFVGTCGFNLAQVPATFNSKLAAPISRQLDERSTSIPYWLIFIGTAIVPLTWLAMRIWARRPRPGYCDSCGYDLRASAGRCPECGWSIGQPAVGFSSRLRSQRIRFAAGVLLLLLSIMLSIAWKSSTPKPCMLLDWKTTFQNDPWQISIEKGMVGLAGTMAAGGRVKPMLPVWVCIAGMMGVAAWLFWSARQLGTSSLIVLDSSGEPTA